MIKKLSNKVDIWNRRMLYLMGGEKLKTDPEWCKKIGVLPSNLAGIKRGTRNFTIEQMIRAAKLHNTTLDYICGLTDNKSIPESILTPIQMIEQGLEMLKIQGFQP